MDILRIAPIFAAGVIGALYGRGLWTLSLAALIPIIVFTRRCRADAAAAVLLYYGAASWSAVGCARSFWSSPPLAAVTWLAATLLLSLPWITLWSATKSQIHWREPLSMLIGAVPPFGLIGWASPLTAAGALFPGTSWFGLSAVAFMASLPLKAVSVAALAANFIQVEPTPPQGWETLDTQVNTAARLTDPVADFEAVSAIQTAASQTNSPFLLAPESAVLRWNEAAGDFIRPSRTLLLGTAITIPGSTDYRNVLLAIGQHTGTFVQRNPVPFAMWKPLGGPDNTSLRLTGPATLQIAEHRAAVLICYEQLLTWPILQSVLENPTIILGIANNYWCRGTRVPQAQQSCTRAWARLFNLPFLTATNQ